MRRPTTTLLCLLLATPAAATSGPPPSASAGPAGLVLPVDDAGLLQAMRAGYVALLGERGRARQILGRLNAERYDQRLAAQRGDPAVDEARARLVDAWLQRYREVSGPQPVDPRAGCRHQASTLREAMGASQGEEATGRLLAARAEARQCLQRLEAALLASRTTAQRLDAVLAEARALLDVAGRAAPTDAAGAARERQGEHEREPRQGEDDAPGGSR